MFVSIVFSGEFTENAGKYQENGGCNAGQWQQPEDMRTPVIKVHLVPRARVTLFQQEVSIPLEKSVTGALAPWERDCSKVRSHFSNKFTSTRFTTSTTFKISKNFTNFKTDTFPEPSVLPNNDTKRRKRGGGSRNVTVVIGLTHDNKACDQELESVYSC